MSGPPVQRGLVQTPLGLVHYKSIGSLESSNSGKYPILAFHMSPRSIDEYKEVMPLICKDDDNRMVVAIDELGYGQSDSPQRSCALDEIADCALKVADEIGIIKFVVTGSLMGCYIALSLTSRYPDRVMGIICTNLYYFPKDKRDAAMEKAAKQQKEEEDSPSNKNTVKIENSWQMEEDGSHFTKLFAQRSQWLDPVLNTRVVYDQVTYHLKRMERYATGVYIQDGETFDLPSAAKTITCPILCLKGIDATAFFDMIGYDMTGQFDEAISYFSKPPQIKTIKKHSSINMINQNPEDWSTEVLTFLNANGL